MNSKSSAQSINWRQAFVEVSLIVAGILIALAVDAWWDQRQEREAEVSYLEALRQDFATNRESLLAQIALQQDIVHAGDDVLKMINAGLSDASSEEFFRSVTNDLYFFENWTPVTGTYDNIIASGHLLYIENQPLRVRLAEFRKSLEVIEDMESLQSRTFYERQSPFLSKYQNNDFSEWSEEYRPPSSPFDVDISKFATLEYWNLVVEWIYVHSDVISQYRQGVADCERILQIIDAELDAKRS